MSSLKEIKTRIGSIDSTLKITSAMRLVSSAKLRKYQRIATSMIPYDDGLSHLLLEAISLGATVDPVYTTEREVHRVAIVCISSNSSLCGGFNNNVIRKALSSISDYRSRGARVSVFPIGKKIAEALRKNGYSCSEDYSHLSETPSYGESSILGNALINSFVSGTYDEVILIYNHFRSTSSQQTLLEKFLPLSVPQATESETEYIFEPDKSALMDALLPKSLLMKLYTVLIDAQAAQHAARTIAMQTATDNGNELLQTLTLEYNKGRQQEITTELVSLGASRI